MEEGRGTYRPYEAFAHLYELFMDQVPYGLWKDMVLEQIRLHGVSRPKGISSPKGEEATSREGWSEERDLIVDLACGTGTFCRMLALEGYDCMGVDVSEEMLEVARNHAEDPGDIWYLCQDMRQLDLFGTAGTIVCLCDSLNYLLEDGELERVFALVDNYLYPGGLFIFDWNTPAKYLSIGDSTIAENREEAAFIWENQYEEASRRNHCLLTFFVSEGEDIFGRCQEEHTQRAYTTQEVEAALEATGLELLCMLDGEGGGPASLDSQRILAVARERKKQKR